MIVTALLLALGLVAIVDFFTGWLEGAIWWTVVGAAAGLIGLYHLIAHILQKPLVGLTTGLDFLARGLLSFRLRRRDLNDRFDWTEFNVVRGQIKRREEQKARLSSQLFD